MAKSVLETNSLGECLKLLVSAAGHHAPKAFADALEAKRKRRSHHSAIDERNMQRWMNGDSTPKESEFQQICEFLSLN